MPAESCASAPAASARRLETPTSSADSDCARPRAVATPTRRPVKVPGPTPTAMRSISRQLTPAATSSSRAIASRRVACPGCAPAAGSSRACVVRRPPDAAQQRLPMWTCRGRARSRRAVPRRRLGALVDVDPSPVAAAVTERHAHARARELGVRVLRPLDERDPSRPEVVGEQIGILALEARESVEIQVRDAERALAV